LQRERNLTDDAFALANRRKTLARLVEIVEHGSAREAVAAAAQLLKGYSPGAGAETKAPSTPIEVRTRLAYLQKRRHELEREIAASKGANERLLERLETPDGGKSPASGELGQRPEGMVNNGQ
jgi:hypothetical protein